MTDTEHESSTGFADSADSTAPLKVLLHVAYPLWRKHTVMNMARAKQLQDEGNDVVLTYCNSSTGTCAANYAGSPVACLICRHRVKSTAAKLGLRAVPLETNDTAMAAAPPLQWREKKGLAEGVQSGIITTFRTFAEDSNASALISKIKRRYFRTSSRLLRSMKNVVQQEKPDRVEVFNGRHACSRLSLLAAEGMGIPFNTLEATIRQKPILFAGHTAHDRRAIQQRVLKQPADEQVAEDYYARRREPRSNKFARKHAQDFVPPSRDGFRKKISIFLSSQDEFESLGKDWVSPFLDYPPIIKAACLQHPEHLFCIRFHPNQADIAGDIITPFHEIAELPNTRVFYPTDSANTYTLIDWSDLVVTFGSTVTVEACWMHKPVIMLGPSFFDQLDVSWNPATSADFLALLRKDLTPKDRANAARYACFEELDSDPMKYVRHDGRTMHAEGFRVAHPWLSQLARTTDDVICNGIKCWTGYRAKRKKRAA